MVKFTKKKTEYLRIIKRLRIYLLIGLIIATFDEMVDQLMALNPIHIHIYTHTYIRWREKNKLCFKTCFQARYIIIS